MEEREIKQSIKWQPVSRKFPHILHGGDYNPDQWKDTPEIWDEDMRLMKSANINCASIGIFSWAALEPSEGKFTFDWLDRIMDKLADNNIYAVLATPSGSKPAWLSRAYPETCRVNIDGTRQQHRMRHNHCRTSPVYREKCRIINTKLAERYKDHPALLLWHVSNEYNGNDCYCSLCYHAFWEWLKKRYDNNIDNLNYAYWTAFWSHTFPDWDYVIPNDSSIHGLMLDWERFKTDQTIDFFNAESEPLRKITPKVPVTTNFMLGTDTLDYFKFAREVDVVSWDAYPNWHEMDDNAQEAAGTAFLHDIARSSKNGKPFMMMESVPSVPTRCSIKKRKKPLMHFLSSMQAIAHGSDTVQYFQWRKGRGGSEKFHGAVVDHAGHENTRVFRDVAQLGKELTKCDSLVGSSVTSEVALIYDWENQWALDKGAVVYLGENVKYREVCLKHYRQFWEAGIPVDIVDQTFSLDKYKLVIAPMVYMLRPGFADELKKFVSLGNTAVMTYWSGVVDQSDLCFLGGVPGNGLRELFGVWEEESQSYFPKESVSLQMEKPNLLNIYGEYQAFDTCSVVHAENSTVLAKYTSDYFAGTPALTVNDYGKGQAYYIASRNENLFLSDFYSALVSKLSITKTLNIDLPAGVTAQYRSSGSEKYIFLMNYTEKPQKINLNAKYTNFLTGKIMDSDLELKPFGMVIIKDSV
jgi:beta-galactosidase